MKKESKLKKINMPKEEPEMEMSELEFEEMPADEAPPPEEEAPSEGPSDLEGASDEELLAEIKKRGLESQLGEEPAPEQDFGM